MVKKLVYLDQNTFDRVVKVRVECANVWNDCLRYAIDYWKTNKQWISKTQLQKLTKGNYKLHPQTIQAVVHKYIESREGARQARAKGLNNKYPYKTKKHFTLSFGEDAIYKEEGYLSLSMGKTTITTNKGEIKSVLAEPIIIPFKNIPPEKIVKAELVFDRFLYMNLTLEDGIEPQMIEQVIHQVAVDLGEIHTITAISTQGKGIQIMGREIRAVKFYRNKEISKLYRILSRCKKGSNRYKAIRRRINVLSRKTTKCIDDLLNQACNTFIKWCVKNNIHYVIAGNPEGVQRNTKKGAKKWRKNRKSRQKLSQWDFGKVLWKLQYKLQRAGIHFEKREESYASQTCPSCLRRKKVKGRNYSCSCGFRMYRDYVGALNILSKHLYGDIRDLHLQVTYNYRKLLIA